jgi:hypothetical protein
MKVDHQKSMNFKDHGHQAWNFTNINMDCESFSNFINYPIVLTRLGDLIPDVNT